MKTNLYDCLIGVFRPWLKLRKPLILLIYLSLFTAIASHSSQSQDKWLANAHQHLEKNPADLNTRLKLAKYYFQHSEEQKTIDLLKSFADQLPKSGSLLLAKAFENKKDYINQIRVLNNLHADDDKDYQALTMLGQAYLNAQKDLEAIQNFRAAIAINKSYRPAYEGLITAFKQNKNTYELRVLYQDMLKLWGEKPEYLQELCRLNVIDGYFDQAATYCPQAVSVQPRFPDSHVYWSQYLKDSGNEKQAVKILQKAAQMFPKSEFVQWTYGQTMENQKNYAVALKHYELAVKADSKSARALAGVGKSAFETKNLALSLTSYNKACELDRKYLQEIRTYASILRNEKQKEWQKRFEMAAEKCGL